MPAWRIGMTWLVMAGLLGSAASGADSDRGPVAEVPGERVAQFYTRVISGPMMNRSVCYVCRYGERPVVMVLARQVGPELRPLVKNIDRVVEKHRGGGLRSFGVLLSDEGFPAVSAAQTFAFSNRIAMPLTVGTEAAEGGRNLAPRSAVAVVLYHRQRVVARYALRPDELDVEHYTPIIEGLKAFAAERAAAPGFGGAGAE